MRPFVRIRRLIRALGARALVRARRLAQDVGRWLRPPRVWDLLAAGGMAAVATGLWWIYPPVSLIVTGLAFMGLGYWGASSWTGGDDRRSSKRRREPS